MLKNRNVIAIMLILLIQGFFLNEVHSQWAISTGGKLAIYNKDPKHKSAIDTAKLIVEYSYSFIRDTINKNKWKDRYVLELGNKLSSYYSIFGDMADSAMYKFTQSRTGKKIDAATNPEAFLKSDEWANYDYYYSYYDKDSIEVYQMIINRIYIYREPTPEFGWTIEPDTMHILGYVCQLASMRFRGRDYKVWFTYEIPISRGPWKLSGLPGLILKAQTLDGYFDFHANRIEVPKITRPIYRYRYKTITITHPEMLKLYRISYEDPVSLVLQSGNFFYCATDSEGKYRKFEPGEISFPYVPFLELE